jgi:D-3-phosphoglycerate dehydrogenase / 2-oxoglutarate reductase
VSKEALGRARSLLLIQQAGAGTDLIDTATAAALGIPVANVPTWASGSADCVAEHALSLMLALTRDLRGTRPQAGDHAPASGLFSLRERTVGIIGLGAIGIRLARLLEPLGADVIATVASNIPTDVPPNVSWVGTASDNERVARAADVVVLTCPLTASTNRLIDETLLASCKAGAFLVNVARGGIVDSAALSAAVRAGHIAGAGLDILDPAIDHRTEHALRADPRVIITPHSAAVCRSVVNQTARIMSENMRRVRAGVPPAHLLGTQSN